MPGQRVATATIRKLRRMYREAWAREWPEDDDYASELWLEARAAIPKGRNKVPPPEVWVRCLQDMRENHPFAAIALN